MSAFRVAASVLAADFGTLADEVRAAEGAGSDWIHVDVMDGHFVPNLSIGPDVVAAICSAATRPVDVHLMIEHPDRFVDRFVEAGAAAVGVHVEAPGHLHRALTRIRDLGARPCVALNPGTPAGAIDAVLPLVDQVLVMTVNPGFGGQAFIDDTLPKIAEVRRAIRRSGRPIDLVVDGGVDIDTVVRAAVHGANVFVTGSAFFGSGDYKRFVDTIRALLAPFTPGDIEGP